VLAAHLKTDVDVLYMLIDFGHFYSKLGNLVSKLCDTTNVVKLPLDGSMYFLTVFNLKKA